MKSPKGRPTLKSTNASTKAFDLGKLDVKQKYNDPIPLDAKLHKDLKALITDLVPICFHRSYWNQILDAPISTNEDKASKSSNNDDDDEDFDEESGPSIGNRYSRRYL